MIVAEKISWDERKALSEQLMNEAQPLTDEVFDRFGQGGGIYIISYTGKELGGSIWQKDNPQIIYVAHNGLDSSRHWKNDTAISTVRRSLAAMLAISLNLNAIPKSADPEDKDRFNNYRLNDESEEKLSQWMRDNLRLAFLPLSPADSEDYYLALIDYNTPMFNFQNNPRNDFGQQIKAYRRRLAEQAAMCEK